MEGGSIIPVPKQQENLALLEGESIPESVLAADSPGLWYVAHTRSRNEKILAKELSRLGVYHYLPLTRRVTRSPQTRRLSRSIVPVFPGYVFFKGTEEQRYRALRTNRIASVLDVPNQAELVAELLHVQTLLTTTNDFAVADRLCVGDWGRIIAGPLTGIEGLITSRSNVLRLSMNVTILGQSVSVEVDSDNVERISSPDHARGTTRSAH